MKNSIGTSVILTLFGESHGEAVGAVLDGLAPGIEVDEQEIAAWLTLRRPEDDAATARREPDRFQVVSGVFNGRTTGAPVCIVIPNEDVRSEDYEAFRNLPRPSHADYTARVKYGGFEDYRGGGHFSGRLTAAVVAVGAIALRALKNKGILVGSHILRCGGIADRPFDRTAVEIPLVNARRFPVLESVEGAMRAAVLEAAREGDSVGGVVQTAVHGLPAGVGDPWFDSVEGDIARAVLAVGGVKGIEFGEGFRLAGMRGSEANDAFAYNAQKVVTLTNRSGGINGGISNGMDILFNTAVKPTPSIARPQQTVDLKSGQAAVLQLSGRHDPAIVRRICPVITSLTAVVVCDLLARTYGTDFLKGIR